jgi:hypothetical protein
MTGAEQSKAEKLAELEALIAEVYNLRDQKTKSLPNNVEGK